MKNNCQTWRLIRDNSYDGLTNMAIDESISLACGEEKSLPTLRLYGWKTPTISLGYSQDAKLDINLPYCESKKIDIIKRPTGGRAVLHENELTFSLNSSITNILFPKNILKSHKKISEALLLGVNRLGINALLHYKHIKQKSGNPICFSAPSLYELVVDGKKIIGCAQRRFKKSFLEHGSIPFKLNRKKLAAIFEKNLPVSDKKLETKYFDSMAGLNELGYGNFSVNQVSNNIIEGFEVYFGIAFKEGNLSDYERELVAKTVKRQVAATKRSYRSGEQTKKLL